MRCYATRQTACLPVTKTKHCMIKLAVESGNTTRSGIYEHRILTIIESETLTIQMPTPKIGKQRIVDSDQPISNILDFEIAANLPLVHYIIFL